MTKQEFMAFSLPYGLKYPNGNEICEIDGIIGNYYISIEHIDGEEHHIQPYIEDLETLILRPISDLTKEIEHNGEKFVPIERLAFEFKLQMYQFIDGAFYDNNYRRYLDIKEMPFVVVLKLISWNFDLFGGIEKGEAIDVNTLETNPYK